MGRRTENKNGLHTAFITRNVWKVSIGGKKLVLRQATEAERHDHEQYKLKQAERPDTPKDIIDRLEQLNRRHRAGTLTGAGDRQLTWGEAAERIIGKRTPVRGHKKGKVEWITPAGAKSVCWLDSPERIGKSGRLIGAGYKYSFRRCIEHFLDWKPDGKTPVRNMRLSQLTREHMATFHKQISTSGGKINYVSTTLNKVKRFFSVAAEIGLINESPMKGMKVVAPVAVRKYLLTDKDKENILAVAGFYRPHFEFLFITGFRTKEVLRMTAEQIELRQNDRVRINYDYEQNGAKSKGRSVVLSGIAAQIIRKQLTVYPNGNLFPCASGKQCQNNLSLMRVLDKLKVREQLDRQIKKGLVPADTPLLNAAATPYCSRHEVLTKLFGKCIKEDGGKVGKQVANLAHHAGNTPNQILKTYLQYSDEDADNFADTMFA